MLNGKWFVPSGYAHDPSVGGGEEAGRIIGDGVKEEEEKGMCTLIGIIIIIIIIVRSY